MMATKYLHTLNGKPAEFDGWQIVYATHYGKACQLADSLKQIRKEQKTSFWNRHEEFGEERLDIEHGYRRIAV